MLSNADLAAELNDLAKKAIELGRQVKANGDLPARTLAVGLVEVDKIGQRLAKLRKQLGGGNGKKRK